MADDRFWYSVSTTGVYCRPPCPLCGCNSGNVTTHATLEDARRTGFRPCKRRKPEGPGTAAVNARFVTRACRLIEDSETPPSLADLAAQFALSPGYLHFAVGETTLGSILVTSSAKGVAAILLGDDPDALVRDLQDRFPRRRG